MAPLLIATTNRGKLLEIQDLLPGFELVIPSDLGIELEVEETGQTYTDNASLKAEAYCRLSGRITLADDSGLEVDCLDGRPGLHSARYSPQPNASDADRRALLLRNLAAYPRPWLAHFHCTVAVAVPVSPGLQAGQGAHSGQAAPVRLYFSDGDCPGEIIPAERGSNGFGYDPIFLLQDLGLTMAELTRDQKNQLSHRARAVKAALPVLNHLLDIG
jgi:XTP/dITP diphosphohydrolase